MVAIIGCDYGLQILPENNFGRRGNKIRTPELFLFAQINLANHL